VSTLALFPAAHVPLVESTDHQNTPRDLAIDLGWFDLDPCSNPLSHIQARTAYALERGQDGLALPWEGSVFCNGNYSDPLPWCERLRQHNAPWMALWKLDTTTSWWRSLMAARPWWAPFRQRLRFERDGNCGVANFTSVLVWKDFELSDELAGWLWAARREA
jgi:hypothetical protein